MNALPIVAAALIGGATVGAGATWYVTSLQADNDALTASLAASEREKAVLTQKAAQATHAAEIARNEAQRYQARANEYDALRESLTNGDNDAPIPDWFCQYLNRLLGAGACDSDGADGP